MRKLVRLEHVSEFKYLGCILDGSGTYEKECSRKMANGSRVVGSIWSLVNARSLENGKSPECTDKLVVWSDEGCGQKD